LYPDTLGKFCVPLACLLDSRAVPGTRWHLFTVAPAAGRRAVLWTHVHCWHSMAYNDDAG